MSISRDSLVFRYANFAAFATPETGSDLVHGCFLSTICLAMWAIILTPVLYVGCAFLMLWAKIAPSDAVIWHDVDYLDTLPYQVGLALAFYLTLRVLSLVFRLLGQLCNRIKVEARGSSLIHW